VVELAVIVERRRHVEAVLGDDLPPPSEISPGR
jgi:hypothetical protein